MGGGGWWGVVREGERVPSGFLTIKPLLWEELVKGWSETLPGAPGWGLSQRANHLPSRVLIIGLIDAPCNTWLNEDMSLLECFKAFSLIVHVHPFCAWNSWCHDQAHSGTVNKALMAMVAVWLGIKQLNNLFSKYTISHDDEKDVFWVRIIFIRTNCWLALLEGLTVQWKKTLFVQKPESDNEHEKTIEIQVRSRYTLLHRKCDIRISIYELQNFGRQTSGRSKQVSFQKFCNEWIKICTKHFLCCNLFIIHIKRNKHFSQVNFNFLCTRMTL